MNSFEQMEAVIAQRRAEPQEGSYTCYLFEKGIDKILKKVGEEAAEIIIAAKNPDSDEVKSYGGHNIVLMTKQFDTDGYDVKLRECIKIGVPEKFDINELKCDERLVDLLNGNELSSDPFLWGMESISDDYQPI